MVLCLFPLGGNLFASVQKRNGEVKIHIKRYCYVPNVKGGKVVPSRNGVSLDLSEFLRMTKIKQRLVTEFYKVNPSEKEEDEPKRKRRRRRKSHKVKAEPPVLAVTPHKQDRQEEVEGGETEQGEKLVQLSGEDEIQSLLFSAKNLQQSRKEEETTNTFLEDFGAQIDRLAEKYCLPSYSEAF